MASGSINNFGETYNAERKERREKRTPEQVEAEKAAQRTRMREGERAPQVVARLSALSAIHTGSMGLTG